MKAYLIAGGIASHVVVIFAFIISLRYFQLTPTQFMVRGVEKLGIDAPWLVALLSPSPQYVDHRFDGVIRDDHPRIIHAVTAKNLGLPEFFSARMSRYADVGINPYNPCAGGSLLDLAGCWITSGDADKAERLIGLIKKFNVETPDEVGSYGNGWELAVAYDFLRTYAGFTDADRAMAETKIRNALKDYLAILDEPGPTLWHGRATLAARAWLCAVVLDSQNDQVQAYQNRAQGHFLGVMRALALTEAWPEGYNYWVNNRGFIVALGATAYINALEGSKYASEIKNIVERVGLWHVYATRPDNRIEGIADEGPRVDLKDETQRVIDVMAQLTDNSVLATFSRYTRALHGDWGYFPTYRWSFALFNNPNIPVIPGVQGKSLAGLGVHLPQSDIFGKGAMNLGYIRSGWGPDDTFISYRAGKTFVQHGHYDAGHFTLYKGAPLAITSGTYGEFFSPHRLNYAIRTVAKNSILVMRPGEKVQPNRFFENNVSDGGQRVVIPTGSSIESVEQWQENINDGFHFEGADVIVYDHSPGLYTYIAADLTGAYNNTKFDAGGNGGKVSAVTREWLYLHDEDRLFIHDHVNSTNEAYTKKWLLHTINQPQASGLRVLKGTDNNGILETNTSEIRVENGRGRLLVNTIAPREAKVRLIGGQDFQFYVESDGDDSDLDGANMAEGAKFSPWFDTGMWRIEIQPVAARQDDHFLVALSPSLDVFRNDAARSLDVESDGVNAAQTASSLVMFVDRRTSGPIEFYRNVQQKKLCIMGLPANRAVRIASATNSITANVNSQGVLVVPISDIDAGKTSVTW